MGLAINVASHHKNAEAICNEDGVKFLLRKALKTEDILIMKMVRQLARLNGSYKLLFLVFLFFLKSSLFEKDYIDPLMAVIKRKDVNQAFLVETLGILAALNIPDFDYRKLSETYHLLDFIQFHIVNAIGESKHNKKGETSHLSPNDDIVLECVIWLGTMTEDEGFCELVGASRIVSHLIDLMTGSFI